MCINYDLIFLIYIIYIPVTSFLSLQNYILGFHIDDFMGMDDYFILLYIYIFIYIYIVIIYLCIYILYIYIQYLET